MSKLVQLAALTYLFIAPTFSTAADLTVASSNIGNGLELLRIQLSTFEQQTGHTASLVHMPDSSSEQFAQYKVWLSAQSKDVDIYLTDVIWAPQLAHHFADLTVDTQRIRNDFLPTLVESQTVDGRLVALPLFTAAPALFYRTDLLRKYALTVPETWAELEQASTIIMEGERASGQSDFWGYVFQGGAYEGLTANALEWLNSSHGGPIIAADGSIAINNVEAAAAIELAASWIGTITPEGVLAYQEEESRGVWQLGNAAFMRNWPYAWTLGNFDDSLVKGKFGVSSLPHGQGATTATLGGWNVAVSKYSEDQEAAIELALFLISRENQEARLAFSGDLPALAAPYDDVAVIAEFPMMPEWRAIMSGALARPSAITKGSYNEASAAIWSAVHASLSQPGTASSNIEGLAVKLEELREDSWR